MAPVIPSRPSTHHTLSFTTGQKSQFVPTPVPLSSDRATYMGLEGFAPNYVGHQSCPRLISNRQLGWQDADAAQEGGTTHWSEKRGTNTGNTCQGQYYYTNHINRNYSWGPI